jgi:hypothetical protein
MLPTIHGFEAAQGATSTARARFTHRPLRRFPPLREGNRAWHTRSVPPACMGNLQKGGVECPRFGEVWLDG